MRRGSKGSSSSRTSQKKHSTRITSTANTKYLGSKDAKNGRIARNSQDQRISKRKQYSKKKKEDLKISQSTCSILLNKHDWQEEEWDTRVIGFVTKVIPKCMPKENATKVITSIFQKNKANLRISSFRLQNISLKTDRTMTRGFGLDVRAENSSAITAAINANFTAGSFVPFNLRATNEMAFKKGIENVHFIINNKWSFIVHYVSEATFFKFENRIKAEMSH